VLLSERLYLRRESYFSIMMDRASQGPVMVGCAEGGTSIEDLAASEPVSIIELCT
jgi:succinyl-CoA synthetase beta subunit